MPFVVRQAVCLGIPVVDGTVVQATRASRRLLTELRHAYPGEPPRLTVVAALAGDAIASFEDVSYAAQLEARRHFLQGRRGTDASRFRPGDAGRLLLQALLGVALIVASAGHWIPALAGVWLLGIRSLVSAAPPVPRPAAVPESARIDVRRANHSGLAALRDALSEHVDEKAGYAAALELSLALGLPEPAALYTKLLQDPNPGHLPPDDGIWLLDATRYREALTGGPAPEVEADQAPVEDVEVVDAEVIDLDQGEDVMKNDGVKAAGD